MYNPARRSIAAVYMTVHVLLAGRYALLYCQSRQSLFVMTRGLSILLINLLSSVIIAVACCLRQIAADTNPDSPLAFEIPCGYMEAASLCMMTMLWPSVMDRGLVLMVKFDPSLRQRYGSYITTQSRGKMLVMYVFFGCLLYLAFELLDAECFVEGTCDRPNCLMGDNLKALLPLSSIMGTFMFFIASRLSRMDLEQEGLGIKDELNLNLMTQGLLTPCMIIQISMQFDVLKPRGAWEFVVTVLQILGTALAFFASDGTLSRWPESTNPPCGMDVVILFGSHIRPSLRLGFAPEPIASLLCGPRVSPEDGDQSSGPYSLGAHRRRSHSSHAQLQLSAPMEGGEVLGLNSSLRQGLLSTSRVPPSPTRQESDKSTVTTPRSPSGLLLTQSPTSQLEGSSAGAPLLQGGRISPAFDVWELQLMQWRSLVPTLQVHLDHPALLQYLDKEAAALPLSPTPSPPKGTVIGSFSNKRHGSIHDKSNSGEGPRSPTTRISIGTVPASPSGQLSEAHTTQEAVGLPASDARLDPEASCVASLLEVARSGLQEEALRFVLVVLVMRTLDPKDKAHREMIRQHCNVLLATHFDPKCARYRLDVSSEAEAAPLREVQKLARRAVLFADDVSNAMHSFDAAFTQLWPAVYELLENHCVSLSVMTARNDSSTHSYSSSVGTKDEKSAVIGSDRRLSHRNSQTGTAEGVTAATAASLQKPLAAGVGLGQCLSQNNAPHRAGEGTGGQASDHRSTAKEHSAPRAAPSGPLPMCQDSPTPLIGQASGVDSGQTDLQAPSSMAGQSPPGMSTGGAVTTTANPLLTQQHNQEPAAEP